MGQVILGPSFSKGSGSKTLDPRLLSIMSQAAAISPYNVVFQQGVAARSTGTVNHPNGYAMDVQLQDPKTGALLPNDGPAAKPYFKQYEQLAQTARVVQQQAYPELNGTFRWGGPWAAARGNPSGSDFEHFDINPGVGGVTPGSMGSYTWADGFGNGGLNANKTFVNQVQSQYAQLQKGLLPPSDIPGTQTASAAPIPATAPNDLSAFANVGSVANSALKAINAEAPPPLPIPRPSTIRPGQSGAGDMLAFNPQATGTAPVPGWGGLNYPWDRQTLPDGNPSIPMDAGLSNGMVVPLNTAASQANFNTPPNFSGPPDERRMPWQPPTPILPVAATGNTQPYAQPSIAATGNTEPYTPVTASGSSVAMPASGPQGSGSAAVQTPPATSSSFLDGIYNFLQGPYNERVAAGRPDLPTVLQAPYNERVAAGRPDLGQVLQAPYNQSHMTQDVGAGANPLTEAQKLAMISAPSPISPPTILSVEPKASPSQSGLTEAQKLALIALPPNTIASPLTSHSIPYTPRVPATAPTVSGQTSPIYGTPAAPTVIAPPLPRPRPAASLDELLYPNGPPTRSWLDGLPPSPTQGQIATGGDGKNYQFVQGANGGKQWGWEQTTQAAPGGWDSNGVPSWVTGQNSPYDVTYPPAATADNPGTVLGGAVRQVPVSALQPLANGLTGIAGLIAPPAVSQPPTQSYSSGNGGQHIMPSYSGAFSGASASGGTNYSSPNYSQATTGNVGSSYDSNYGTNGYSGNSSYGPDSYAATPPLPIPRPTYVQPTYKTVTNPAYTQWLAQPLPDSYPISSAGDTGMSWAAQNTGDPSDPFSSFASPANLPPSPVRGPQPAPTIRVQVPGVAPVVPMPAPPPGLQTPDFWGGVGKRIGDFYNGTPWGHLTNFVTGNSAASTGGGLLSLFGNNGNGGQSGGIGGLLGAFHPALSTPTQIQAIGAGIPLNPMQKAGSTPEYIAAVNAGSPSYTPANSNTLMPTTTTSGGFRYSYGDSGSSGSLASRG